MEYKFTIAAIPDETTGYHLPAETEGPLEVWLEGHRFLKVDDALLVEFAIVLAKWLESQPESLYYASMDFEEEPIFALTQEGDRFEPSSVWASGEPVMVPVDDALAAARRYIDDLGRQLNEQGADLDSTIEEAIAADS